MVVKWLLSGALRWMTDCGQTCQPKFLNKSGLAENVAGKAKFLHKLNISANLRLTQTISS